MDRTKVSGAFDLGSTPNGGAFLTAVCKMQAAVFCIHRVPAIFTFVKLKQRSFAFAKR